jgi:hypothetical protein
MHFKTSSEIRPGLKKHEHRLYESRQEREAEAKRLNNLKQALQKKLSAHLKREDFQAA